MLNYTVITTTRLAKVLVEADKTGITAKTVSVDTVGEVFSDWKDAIATIKDEAYNIAQAQSVNKLTNDQQNTPISDALYSAIGKALKMLGTVNGAPLRANPDFARDVIKEATVTKPCTVTKGSQLELYKKELTSARANLRAAQNTNGVTAEWIKSKEEAVEKAKALVEEWSTKDYQKESRKDPVSMSTFMKKFNVLVHMALTDRCAMPLEEVKAQEEERKNKRKQAAKEARKAKRQAQESVTE